MTDGAKHYKHYSHYIHLSDVWDVCLLFRDTFRGMRIQMASTFWSHYSIYIESAYHCSRSFDTFQWDTGTVVTQAGLFLTDHWALLFSLCHFCFGLFVFIKESWLGVLVREKEVLTQGLQLFRRPSSHPLSLIMANCIRQLKMLS